MLNKSRKIKKNLHQIGHIPILELDITQEPFELFSQLQQKYQHYGAVQLSVSWNLPTFFENMMKPINTRVQNLSKLKYGESFVQKVGAHTVKSYKKMAQNFSKQYLQIKDLEQTYWQLFRSNKDCQVEYAADLSSKKFGSAFPQHHFQIGKDKQDYSTNKFNLCNVNFQKDSAFQCLSRKSEQISGVTVPWVYLGMLFSTFCWHTENMYFSSLNYHHQGENKIWYVIPPSQKEKFEQIIIGKGLDLNILKKVSLMIDPLELMEKGMTVYKCIQKPKTFVLTFPKAYHCGFSLGYNITEAINFCLIENLHYIERSIREDIKFPIMAKEYIAHKLLNYPQIQVSEKNLQIIKQLVDVYIRNNFKITKLTSMLILQKVLLFQLVAKQKDNQLFRLQKN
ncbi:hypothetical protein pb186bvf_004400 [Paramecium bursaria]